MSANAEERFVAIASVSKPCYLAVVAVGETSSEAQENAKVAFSKGLPFEACLVISAIPLPCRDERLCSVVELSPLRPGACVVKRGGFVVTYEMSTSEAHAVAAVLNSMSRETP